MTRLGEQKSVRALLRKTNKRTPLHTTRTKFSRSRWGRGSAQRTLTERTPASERVAPGGVWYCLPLVRGVGVGVKS